MPSNRSQKSKKKTRTTNYKGNVKREGYKRHQQIAQEQAEAEFNEKIKSVAPNGTGADAMEQNTNWGKKFSREYFGYYKDNAILCRLVPADKASPQQLHKQTKLIEKYEKQGLDISYREIDGKDYLCRNDILQDWIDKINPISQQVVRPDERTEMKQNDIKKFLWSKLVNPPKCNGKLNNLTIGFMGSIFMDFKAESGNQYRMSLFNCNGEIHYDKNGNPVGEVGDKFFHTDKRFKPVCEWGLETDRFKDGRFQAISIGADGVKTHTPAPKSFPDGDEVCDESDNVCEIISKLMGGEGECIAVCGADELAEMLKKMSGEL